MLWIGNIFGWPKGGSLSQPAFCALLAELDPLRDVVDTITVSGYYTADPETGNMTNAGSGVPLPNSCRERIRECL